MANLTETQKVVTYLRVTSKWRRHAKWTAAFSAQTLRNADPWSLSKIYFDISIPSFDLKNENNSWYSKKNSNTIGVSDFNDVFHCMWEKRSFGYYWWQ